MPVARALTDPRHLFEAIAGYCGSQSGGPLGDAELLLSADSGDVYRFRFETFFNRYDALTLGVLLGPHVPAVAVSA